MSKLNSFVVIDMEFNCDHKGNVSDIIQIGCVKVNGVTGEKTDGVSWYVKPHKPITSYCEELTGITNEILQTQGITFNRAMKLMRALYGSNTTYYAWGTDTYTIQRWCKGHNIESPIKFHTNFQSLYQNFIPTPTGNIGLKQAMADNGLTFEGSHHDALCDAMNTADLILKVMQRCVAP